MIDTGLVKDHQLMPNQTHKLDDSKKCTSPNVSKRNLNETYAILKQNVQQCYWLIEKQREILREYDELAEEHGKLKEVYQQISFENKMWQVDIERVRWAYKNNLEKHQRSKSPPRIMNAPDKVIESRWGDLLSTFFEKCKVDIEREKHSYLTQIEKRKKAERKSRPSSADTIFF